MAGRPLRPATDRRLGEPLPHQLANPISAAPIARGPSYPRSPAFSLRTYAVLAILSDSYPPRLGTFRYITHPFAARRQGCPRAAARLACVKHSASVQSEPGSNSSVQSVCFTTHSNESQRPNFYIRPFLLSCKCLLPYSLASSSSRSFTSRFRTPLRTQPKSFNPDQQPSLRSRNDSPPPPPAQQAPTPIGCLVFKELPPYCLHRGSAISREERL